MLPLLGKVLHFALTRKEPFNGHLPDLQEPALGEYTPVCRRVIELCVGLDADPAALPEARAALLGWAGRS